METLGPASTGEPPRPPADGHPRLRAPGRKAVCSLWVGPCSLPYYAPRSPPSNLRAGGGRMVTPTVSQRRSSIPGLTVSEGTPGLTDSHLLSPLCHAD